MISDEIRAKVDEAEVALELSTFADEIKHADHDRAVNGLAPIIRYPDADLIVSVVNRERAQIEHARDVLERHRSNGHPLDPRCIGCPDDLGGDPAVPIDQCLELLSLAPAWGVSA